MLSLSAYKEPIVVEKEKYGLWHLGHSDGRVDRAESERNALEREGAARALAGIATMNHPLLSAPNYTPSFAQLDVLPKWTPARWTNAHWSATSMPATQLPVMERYNRLATSWGVDTLMEAGRREEKERVVSRLVITNPYQ